MIPPKSHQRWQALVTNSDGFRPSTLSARIFMQRIGQRVKADPSAVTVAGCINDLHAFFVKYEQIEHDDLVQLFGKEIS